MEVKKTTHQLNEYDLANSRVLSQGFYRREIRLFDKRSKPLVIDFSQMSPQEIEEELQRGLEVGCNRDKIEAVKADYHVWNIVQDQIRQKAMVVVADATQEIMVQTDGTLLSENDLAQIDYALAKCEKKEEIAKRFGTSEETISIREMQEHQAIIDLRRRLNAELEDSTIGLAHDFVRLEELQETLEIVKAHIMEYESTRNRTDLSAEERLHRMAAIPNIISLLNTKEKIIASASKEMKSRKEVAAATGSEFDLTSEEQLMFEELHQKFPVLELVVARASADNGWDTAYMLERLNQSIYKNFRRSTIDDVEHEIIKEKDMTISYPSTQPVDLDEVITSTDARDHDRELMSHRDINIDPDKLKSAEDKKQELLERIRNKAKRNEGEDKNNATDS